MANTAKRIRECVFCGGRPLSFEHVIPKWISRLPLVRRELDSHTNHGKPRYMRHNIMDEYGVTTGFEFQQRGRHYPMNAMEVRVVCAACNMGWMSALEVDAASRLTPLINGEITPLSGEDLAILGAWATKTAMMFEWDDPPHASFTTEQRTTLYEKRKPPTGVAVLAARFNDVGPLRLLHSGGPMSKSPDFADSQGIGATAIVIGHLALLVYNASDDASLELVKTMTKGDNELWRMVWPVSMPEGVTHVVWSPHDIVNHRDIFLAGTIA